MGCVGDIHHLQIRHGIDLAFVRSRAQFNRREFDFDEFWVLCDVVVMKIV